MKAMWDGGHQQDEGSVGLKEKKSFKIFRFKDNYSNYLGSHFPIFCAYTFYMLIYSMKF